MSFYARQYKYYCGIDLHARTMYLCSLNRVEDVLLRRVVR